MQIKRFRCEKLIRDKLPSILQAQGIRMSTRIMNEAEYIKSLKLKLIEEANEVKNADSRKELEEELGDLIEVAFSIMEFYRIELDDVQQIAEKKNEEKGGFHEKIYCESIEMPSDHPKVAYYQTNKYEEF